MTVNAICGRRCRWAHSSDQSCGWVTERFGQRVTGIFCDRRSSYFAEPAQRRRGRPSADWRRQIGRSARGSQHNRGWEGGGEAMPLCGQGHLHKLKLEVELEGVGRDEPQLARRDGAGEEGEGAALKQDLLCFSWTTRPIKHTEECRFDVKQGFRRLHHLFTHKLFLYIFIFWWYCVHNCIYLCITCLLAVKKKIMTS